MPKLAKVGVEGSNPFARSSFLRLKSDDEPAHSAGFLFLDQTRAESRCASAKNIMSKRNGRSGFFPDSFLPDKTLP